MVLYNNWLNYEISQKNNTKLYLNLYYMLQITVNVVIVSFTKFI